MPRIEYTVETDLPPDKVLAAATNFTEHRPDLWPGISRKFYKVHEVGDTWADCTEGSDIFGGIWAREHYDWSTPGVVRSVPQESNIFAIGTGIWEMRVEPRNGGSVIHVLNNRQGKGFKGAMGGIMMTLMGRRMLTKSLHETLDIMRQEDEKQPAPAGATEAPAAEAKPGSTPEE